MCLEHIILELQDRGNCKIVGGQMSFLVAAERCILVSSPTIYLQNS